MSRPEIAVLRRAAEIIGTGWAPGATNALDAQDRAVPLFSDTASDTGRATLNPVAAKFSIYGAIVVATGELGGGLMHDVWEALAAKVIAKGGRGGLVAYNAAEGRTAAECAAILTDVATDLENAETAVSIPTQPATETTHGN